ncbi:MAG: hypothetical protein ACRDQ5_03170 [Sciscionella sp.]
MLRRIAPIIMLAFLSPFVAEFLLADQYLSGPPSFAQLGSFVLFVPLYGFGAVTIRELTRRSGRGWPTMVLLALAFGVVEEGLLTQSLFNPNYLNAHLLDFGFIPALGISAPWTVYVLTLHTVWSICAPIAVVEACFGSREPWLGTVGQGVSTGVYVLGAVATFGISYAMGSHYLAPLPQLLASAVVAIALIIVAFTGFRPRVARTGHVTEWAAFAVGLLASSAFQLCRLAAGSLSATVTTVLLLGIVLVGVVVIARWVRGGAFGLGAGAVVTYCWHGLVTATGYGTAATVEQSVLVAFTLALLVLVARRASAGQPAPGRAFSAAR